MARVPALILTQHSSGFVPFNILADMLGEAVYDHDAVQARLAYLFNEGDPFTDALFYTEDASHVHALISRFVVDLNRRRDAGGLNGVLKVTDFSGNPLYKEDFRFSEKRIEERLNRFYDPFHASLDRMLAKPDLLFFVDGHSMAATGPLIGPDSGKPRPAFTLITGGDSEGKQVSKEHHLSVPADLAQQIRDLLEHHFGPILKDSDVPEDILINDPFALGGTIQRLSAPDNQNHKPGFGLEFNKALYLEPAGNGLDKPIKNRIPLLNRHFQGFMQDCGKLFQAYPFGHA
ncbi:MAG: N-formylglutamate amidohydrolase [Trueperaceae bacterium]|nr:N-formylglutamate amidohydrolase [Trueperaceae bacterium]